MTKYQHISFEDLTDEDQLIKYRNHDRNGMRYEELPHDYMSVMVSLDVFGSVRHAVTCNVTADSPKPF